MLGSALSEWHTEQLHTGPIMGMHADCGHGITMATSMAQKHMQVMTAGFRRYNITLGRILLPTLLLSQLGS